MANIINYPIGVQTFQKIRNNGYLYVDKTAIIHRLVSTSSYVFLSRPRRFGKSLLISTIQDYFEGKRDLFVGLDIEKLESKWESFPVLRMDLSGISYSHIDKLKEKIATYLDNWESSYGKSNTDDIALRFSAVIRKASEQTGKKVVILIDEYDKPLLDTMHKEGDLNTIIREELRGFYSVLKSSDEYIRFAMLTGVTKFGRLSVFSGLNNLKDISMYPRYNAICGISESEFRRDFKESIANFVENNKISEEEAWNSFKSSYDGYHFAKNGEDIYNPFSVLNAFDADSIGDYWFLSGTSDYLVKLIEKYHFRLDRLEGVWRDERALSDITNMRKDIVPLLYQAGYLTIKEYDETRNQYQLGFPNREVSEGFWKSLAEYFFHVSDSSTVFDQWAFTDDVTNGRPEDFMVRLKSLFADTNSENEPDKEIHFQNMMAITFKMLSFAVNTEIHSSQGRCDLTITTAGYIYLFEFKVDSSSEEALAQIHKKGYAVRFEADPREKILIGANFSTKTRTLSDWIIETYVAE